MKPLAAMLVMIRACSSSSDDKKSNGGGASAKGGSANGADQFAGVSDGLLLDKWQGTWAMPFRVGDYTDKSSIGMREIWTIEKTTLTRFNGVSTRSEQVHIIAPCLAKFSSMKKAVVGAPAPANRAA